jgi:hypothetical protein
MTRARRGVGPRTTATIAAVVAAVVALATVRMTAQHLPWTDAAFTGAEYGSGSFTASTLPTPDFTACTYNSTAITVTWQFDTNPANLPASDAIFTVSSTLLGTVSSTLLASQITTTQVSTNHYTTSISSNIVSQLLGAVLSSFTVTAQTGYGSWTSPVSRSAKATSVLITYSCTIS